mmetsp:Transcript_16805/g.44086  ORF Transcript_16805/g.44086 Transcript_16805/m.44086 type:complete len:201 (+) Transcript_16805:63-665(+)
MAEPDAAPALPLFGFCEQRKRQGYYQHYTHEEQTARIKLRAYAFLACVRRKGYDTFDGTTGIGRVVLEFVGPFSWEGITRSFEKEAKEAGDPQEVELLKQKWRRESMHLITEGCQIHEPEFQARRKERLRPWGKLMRLEMVYLAAQEAYEADRSAKNTEAVRRALAAVDAQNALIEDIQAANAAVRVAMGQPIAGDLPLV